MSEHELADEKPWLTFDGLTRRLPGAIWWRLFVRVRLRDPGFETGHHLQYAGLVDRWAFRVPPFNVVIMRLKK